MEKKQDIGGVSLQLMSFIFYVFISFGAAFTSYRNAIDGIKELINESYQKTQEESKKTFTTKEESAFIRQQLEIIRLDVSDIRKTVLNGKDVSKK